MNEFLYSKGMGVSPEEAKKKIIEELGTTEATFYTWVSRYKEELVKEGAIKLVRVGSRDMLLEVDVDKFISFIKDRERRKVSPREKMRLMKEKLYRITRIFHEKALKHGLEISEDAFKKPKVPYVPDFVVYSGHNPIAIVDVKLMKIDHLRVFKLYDTVLRMLLIWDKLVNRTGESEPITIMVYVLSEEKKRLDFPPIVPSGVWEEKLKQIADFVHKYVPVNLLVYIAVVQEGNWEEISLSIENAIQLLKKGERGIYIYRGGAEEKQE